MFMSVQNTINLFVLVMFSVFSCRFTPLANFLYTSRFPVILLLVYGAITVFQFVKKKAGILKLIVCLPALMASLHALFFSDMTQPYDGITLRLIAAWLLVQGVTAIVLGFRRGGWFLGIIAGIPGVGVGIYSFTHPIQPDAFLPMFFLGVVVGFLKDELDK